MSQKSSKKPNKRKAQSKELVKAYSKNWKYLCAFIYLWYCYATLAPSGHVWGIHFLAYFPAPIKLIVLFLGGALLFMPSLQQWLYLKVVMMTEMKSDGSNHPNPRIVGDAVRLEKAGESIEREKPRLLIPVGIAIVSFILFRTFQLKTDIYGDTINMLKWYGNNAAFDTQWLKDIISPNLLQNKEALTVGLHRIVANIFSLSIGTSYQIVSALCGSLFILIWLNFVRGISKGPIRVLLALLGMFAGAEQVFFGHIENYPFGILTSTLFLIAAYRYFEGRTSTVVFLLLYLLAFKAHIVAILFLPALIVALAYRYQHKLPKLQYLLTWKGVQRAIVIPSLVIGALLYVFVFHSWNEPYALHPNRQFEQTFLPVTPLTAPLNHYSLWSPNHIADLLNVFLLIGAPIVILLVNILVFNRKEIVWTPKLIFFAIAGLFPLLFFCAMNPTLSIVRDWDVYTLFFPPLLMFAAVLVTQVELRPYASTWIAQTVVFGVIFTTAFVVVDASPAKLRDRLRDAGVYTYKSYYASSGYIVKRSILLETDKKETIKHLSSVLDQLSHDRAGGRDPELASMMGALGGAYANAGDPESAIRWTGEAEKIDPQDYSYIYYLSGLYIESGNPRQALETLKAIPKDSVGVEFLTNTAIATAYLYGSDSAMPILFRAKQMAPHDAYIDSLISDLKAAKMQKK